VTGPVDLSSPKFSFIRWAGPLLATNKISPALRQQGVGTWAIDDSGQPTLQVLFFADVDPEAATRALSSLRGTVLSRSVNTFTVQFPSTAAIQVLAELDKVQWIDNGPVPRKERSVPSTSSGPENDGARDRTNVNALQSAHADVIGTGVVVGVWDGMVDATHPDFTGRITVDPSHGPQAPVSDHGTHVAGTVGGDGRNSFNHGGTENQWRGVAYGAQIVSYPNDAVFFNTHQGAIQNHNVVVSSNSWGGYLSPLKKGH
jgi:subtilisin family serine protease